MELGTSIWLSDKVEGFVTGHRRGRFMRRPDGSVYDIKRDWFVSTGGNSFGRIGTWVDDKGKPIDGDVYTLPWDYIEEK